MIFMWVGGGGKIPFSVVAAAEAPYFVRKVLDFCFIS